MGIMSDAALAAMGFSSIGKNVRISDRASFHNPARISVGDNSRIDDFCVIAAGAGGISIGEYVHIGVGCTLLGAGAITLSDFSGLSSRVAIYSSSDDYSGASMTNPTVPGIYTDVKHADVFLGKHVIVGSGSVILPGLRLEDGVAIGALSLVTKNCREFGIYNGNPARWFKQRKRDLLALEAALRLAEQR